MEDTPALSFLLPQKCEDREIRMPPAEAVEKTHEGASYLIYPESAKTAVEASLRYAGQPFSTRTVPASGDGASWLRGFELPSRGFTFLGHKAIQLNSAMFPEIPVGVRLDGENNLLSSSGIPHMAYVLPLPRLLGIVPCGRLGL